MASMASPLSLSAASPFSRISARASQSFLPHKTRLPFPSSSSHLSTTITLSPPPSLKRPGFLPPIFSSTAEFSEIEGTIDTELESEATQVAKPLDIPKGEEVFAVVMVGSRQYIVFPGRFLYVQRLKGSNVNDKIILNKVLLVSTKSNTYIGKPVVPNAAVHAVVEDNGLNRKVIVFKYKKKKNYRRNIGHRQPNTRIKITGITGYQDAPAAAPVAV